MGTVLEWGNPLHKPYPLFLIGFGIITIYIPGIVGASISTGWLFLLLISPILLLYCNLKLGVGFVFLIYAGITLIWTTNFNIGLFYYLQLISLACVFCIGKEITDLKPVFKGLALGLGVSSVIAIFQYFGYNYVYSLNNSIAGLFINPNIYSEISVILLISLLTLRLWVWLVFTLPGIILIHSRTALIALGIGLFIWALSFNKRLTISLITLIIIISFIFYWNDFNTDSIQERISIWKDTINGFTFFGNGIGSYELKFPFYSTHINTEIARPRYAHNDILNLIFEFGIGAILALIFVGKMIKNNNPQMVILYVIFIVSLFTYPLHIPATAFIAFLVAGYITRNNDTCSNIGLCRGSNLFKRN